MNHRQYVVQKALKFEKTAERLNCLREYVQALYISQLKDVGWFRYHAFMGGTCLRLCHDIDRFSEDLDFVLVEGKSITVSHAEQLLQKANRKMEDTEFKVRMRPLKDKRNAWKTFVVFEGLPASVKVSNNRHETHIPRFDAVNNPRSAVKGFWLDGEQFQYLGLDWGQGVYKSFHLAVPAVEFLS